MTMKTNGRPFLNRNHVQQRGMRFSFANNQHQVTDARQVLQMKYAQSRKHLGPLNRSSAARNQQVSNQQSSFNQRKNFNKMNQNHQFGIVKQNFKFRKNPGYNNGFIQRNRVGFVQNPERRNRVMGNRSQGFVVNRNFQQFQGNRQGQKAGGSNSYNQGVLVRDKVMVPPHKRVFSGRDGITVTTKTPNTRKIVEGDELEMTTLQDLHIPGVQSISHALFQKKNPPQWASTSSTMTTAPVHSNVHNFMNDTMVADTISPTSNPREENTKVVVSNLLPTVSEEDLVELFGNIGQLIRVQSSHPGKAIIQYMSAGDAVSAVETYDGILLDGKAMHCSMMQNYESRPSSMLAARLGERKGPSSVVGVIPQQTTSILPTATGSRSFYQPAKDPVRFTVKLP